MTNGFLTLVNITGIMRWLVRQARVENGGNRAIDESERNATPTLLTASKLSALAVFDDSGRAVGSAADALFECDTGRLKTLVIRRGGIAGMGERLIAIDSERLRLQADRIDLRFRADELNRLPDWAPGASAISKHGSSLKDRARG